MTVTPPLEEGPETAEVCVSGGRASKRQRRPAKKFDAGWGNDAHEIKAAIKKSLLEQTHTRTISVEIPEALVFYPTPAEFANPLEYIRKLAEQNVGTRTGIVKVVPPPGHAPPLDLNSFPQVPFGTKRQTLQKLTQGETFGEGTRHTHATYRAQALKFQRNFRKRFGHLLRGAHSDLSSAADVKVECSKTPKASSKGGGAAQATGSVVAGTSTSAVVAEAAAALAEAAAPLPPVVIENTTCAAPAVDVVDLTTDDTNLRCAAEDASPCLADEPVATTSAPFAGNLMEDQPQQQHQQQQQHDQQQHTSMMHMFHDYELTRLPYAQENDGAPSTSYNQLQAKAAQMSAYAEDLRKKAEEAQRKVEEGKMMLEQDQTSYTDEEVRAVEDMYWWFTETNQGHVVVEYGNDLDVDVQGTGFGQPKHAWDLSQLPNHPQSVLQHVKQQLKGLNTPWLYLGMMFATFCFHVEDHALFSINYSHTGAPKTWYGIPSHKARAFEEALAQDIPEGFKGDRKLLHNLTAMISPAKLRAHDVPVYRLVQRPGEFVVTFPDAYHGGFSHGFNVGEAVNFALDMWLPKGREAVERYRQKTNCKREAVFSHDRVLWELCKDEVAKPHAVLAEGTCEYKRVTMLRDELKKSVMQEMQLRKHCRKQNVVQQRIVALPTGPHDSNFDATCLACGCSPFFTVVRCSCPNRMVGGNVVPPITCPTHPYMKCSCDMYDKTKRTLEVRVSDYLLETMIRKLEQRLGLQQEEQEQQKEDDPEATPGRPAAPGSPQVVLLQEDDDATRRSRAEAAARLAKERARLFALEENGIEGLMAHDGDDDSSDSEQVN